MIFDAWSPRGVGWALDRHLQAEVALAVLRMALATRQGGSDLAHYADRSVQYISQAYTSVLKTSEIQISIGRRGNPYDNAQAERFIKTLK